MNDTIRMQISAFIDGELPQNETELLLRRLCQDRELRHQAASFMSLGRLMRGERSIAGQERLRARIAAELDDRPVAEDSAVPEYRRRSYLRPIAGAAITATVAIAAVFGLRQTIGVNDTDPGIANPPVAATASDAAYTVPSQPDELLLHYYVSHGVSSSQFGANSINARLVNLQLRQGDIPDTTEPGDEVATPTDDTESAEAPTTP